MASVGHTGIDGSAMTSNPVYLATSGTLSFNTGQVLATVSVGVTTNSSLTGGDEYFTFNLGTPSSGATITTDNGQIYLLSSGDTPVAVNDDYTVANGQTLSAGPGSSQPGLLAGDSDALGDALSVTAVNGTSFTGGITKSTTYGTVTVKQGGSFGYTPGSGLSSGGLDTVTYPVSSPAGGTALATVQIDIEPAPPEITGLPGLIACPPSGHPPPNITGITISDPNEGGDPDIIVTLSVQQRSVLHDNTVPGLAAGSSGDLIMTLTASLASVTPMFVRSWPALKGRASGPTSENPGHLAQTGALTGRRWWGKGLRNQRVQHALLGRANQPIMESQLP